MIRKIFLVVLLIVALILLISCQTIKGLGKDITWIGEKGAEALELENK